MDILDEDLLNFWRSLSVNKVAYMMIGGFAVNMHGYSRATKDVDIWIRDDAENRRRLGVAMQIYGYEDIAWESFQFIPGWTNFNIGGGLELDILVEMKGLESFSFDQCMNFATIATIGGIDVPFLHINHLIANKLAANRPKDQLDVLELQKIKDLRSRLGLD